MKLTYDKTGEEVKAGDVVHLRGDAPYMVHSFSKPHKPASEGKVSVKAMNDAGFFREFYVSVIGATWQDREDRHV
jgi:hypothetical protein